jgi:toxin ParE1/3/4
MGYRLSPTAKRDLETIANYGIDAFGMEAAQKYYAGLVRGFNFLAQYPKAARLRQEVRPPVRAYPCQSHLIVYEIDDAQNILILRVHHAREDWLDL